MHVLRLAAWALLALGLGLAACGGDDEPETSAIESACIAFCDASVGKCPMQQLPVEQCRRACGYDETQLEGHCVAEYTAVFECGSKGGFTCNAQGPVPNDPCVDVTQAWQSCTLAASCSRFCDAAAEAGCPPGGSSSACTTQCNATRAQLGLCETQYGTYLQCAEAFGLTCDGSTVRAPDCDEELPGVGSCVAHTGDACTGYCFASVAMGCADQGACDSTCAAERDASAACKESYESWLTCVLDDFAPTCEAAELVASSCSSQRQTYEACASM